MSSPAQITVTSGPDRGRTFDLADELVHIGSGPENQVTLTDPSIADHQASIVCRQGRYAIYTPIAEAVNVDGDPLPPDQWVWLPEESRIKLGGRTAVLFTSPNGTASNGTTSEQSGSTPIPERKSGEHTPRPTPRPTPKPAGSESVDPFADDEDEDESLPTVQDRGGRGRGKKRRRKRGDRSDKPTEKRQVARFVTDQSGDTVVTLGEDGQLPELKLREGATARERRAEAKPANKEGTSPVLYVILAVSMLSSVGMLLFDFTPGQTSRRQQALARGELREFMGSGADEPEPYQEHLRDALLARQRNDLRAERREYSEVLDLLNAEDNDDLYGLTGNPERDERLRELIGILLSR